MPIGGFSGGDASLSVERLADLIEKGDLRFVMTGGGFGGPPRADGANMIGAVETACIPVSATTWGGSGSSSLFDCAGQANNVRTQVAPQSSTLHTRLVRRVAQFGCASISASGWHCLHRRAPGV